MIPVRAPNQAPFTGAITPKTPGSFTAKGNTTELHTAQLGNKQLQVFDFGCARSQRGLLRVDCFSQCEHLSVARAKCRLLAEQHGFQRFDIVGKWVRARHAGSLRARNDVYNAEVGRAVLVGCRQSMPYSSIDNCAGLRQITPLSA